MSDAARIEALPIWRGKPRVTPSGLGRTNRNFIVEDSERRTFARIGRDLPHHAIRRSVEARCCRIAAAHGIGPDVFYAEDGILVLEMLDGRPLGLPDAADPAMISAIAALLRRLHAIPMEAGLPEFSPPDSALRNLALLGDADLPAPRVRIVERLASLQTPPVRCLVHGDLIPENFILSQGSLFLVDWEYAGLGIPETDIALTIANLELDAARAATLIAGYGPLARRAVEDMRTAAVIREALWCLVQASYGTASHDLADYTALCCRRMEAVLA
jgi:thiamine kinase-like enzyme